MTHITIQPSYDDLVRLIGGDDPVSLEVRRGIMQTFARTHLKPLVNDPVIKDTITALEVAARTEVKAQIGELRDTYAGPRITLTPPMTAALKAQIADLIQIAIRDAVEEFKTTQLPQILADVLARVGPVTQALLNQGIEKQIRDEVNRRLTEAVANIALPKEPRT